jgi:hypothetical protein
MLQLRCPTDDAVLVLGVADTRGILLFPTTSAEVPGIVFRPVSLQPMNLQIIAKANSILATNLTGREIDICQDYSDRVVLEGNVEACLYLAIVRNLPNLISSDWLNFPDQLRKMPKGRNRLAYLRAWQVMTGSLALKTKAIETDDLNNL